MSLAAHRAGHCVGLSVLPLSACRWPGLAPAGDLLLCVAKEEGKKGDPAKPVVGVADDSPALLVPGGRGGTRRRCRLKQPPRTSPPRTPLLGGSERAIRIHRATTERTGVIDGLEFDRRLSKGTWRVESPSEPPSSAATGGAFRRGCLSRRSRRVPRRPPGVSSAGQSAEGRPVKPGRLLCLLSWRSKKVGRPPGRDPANPCQSKAQPAVASASASIRSGRTASPLQAAIRAAHPIPGGNKRGATP